MDEGHPDVEIAAQSIDQGQRKGDLRDENERGPSGLERRRNGLDIDGGLARARHPVEQERPRAASVDRRPDPLDGVGLGGQQLRAVGRPPRDPTGRAASGRRGRSRTSASTRPRRTSPATAAVP